MNGWSSPEATAREFVDWLANSHVRAVIRGGASGATIVRLDGGPIRVETRYLFPSRQAFGAYERDHAPALREDGVRRFGDRGVIFERRVGEVVLSEGT